MKPPGDADPTLWILGLLVATIGLPYFLLATTGPLIQSWVARSLMGTHVYLHLTNRFLWLPPVVDAIARAKGLAAVLIHDAEGTDLRRTDWMLVARRPQVLDGTGIREAVPTWSPSLDSAPGRMTSTTSSRS